MPRPGPRNLSRPATLALALFVWLSSPTTPARAAGCHVPERPVLVTHSSHQGDHSAAWDLSGDRPLAPPVLTKVPCPGEIPQAPVVTTINAHVALTDAAILTPPIGGESLPGAAACTRIQPPPSRLDRPPRSRSGRPA